MYYKKEDLENTIFFDLETVPLYYSLDDLLSNGKIGEIEKVKKIAENQNMSLNKETEKEIIQSLSLIPELNQIICLSFGAVKFKRDENGELLDKYTITTKSYSSLTDENSILDSAIKAFDNKTKVLGGYNIKSFDLPILTKHYLRKGYLPKALNFFGKKVWEVNILDLSNDWKGYSQYPVSLSLLCDFLGVKNPKNGDLTGKNMYEKLINNSLTIEEVEVYCEKDVKSIIECCIKLTY